MQALVEWRLEPKVKIIKLGLDKYRLVFTHFFLNFFSIETRYLYNKIILSISINIFIKYI